MSVSSAGTQLDYSATDILITALTGWDNIGCILSVDRDGITLEMDDQEGCLSSAITSPVVSKHKTPKAVDQGEISGEISFDAAKYAAIRTMLVTAKKGYWRLVDPDNRDPDTGVLTVVGSSTEKVFGWMTKLSKAHPAGGGRMTAKFTITVDTSAYTPKA